MKTINKICTKCHIEKLLSEFDKDLRHKNKCQSQCKICFKLYRENNKEKRIILWKNWFIKNKNKRLKYQRNYVKNRRKDDENFRISQNLRNRLNKVLKRINKSQSTLQLLGCDIEYLKSYLESQFIKNMTWSNYGKWEIDHIIPCSFFNLVNPIHQKLCFHYINLQPLWKKDNQIKKNNFNYKRNKNVFN